MKNTTTPMKQYLVNDINKLFMQKSFTDKLEAMFGFYKQNLHKPVDWQTKQVATSQNAVNDIKQLFPNKTISSAMEFVAIQTINHLKSNNLKVDTCTQIITTKNEI